MSQERKQEIGMKILAVCGQCPHGKWLFSKLICDRKKSQCHSKRVRKWLNELETLQKEVT